MREIGYQIRIKREWVVEFINKYATLFNATEIKLDGGIMQKLYASDFVDFCNMRAIKRVSFHLPRRALKDAGECARVCDFMMDMKFATDAILVTHFYENSVEAEKYAFAISKVAKDKALTVAVENVEIRADPFFNITDPFFYMDELKSFAVANNFKVCLDIPHLLFSASNAKISQEEVLAYLKRDEWWKGNVVELHLHDFNTKRCHLNIGEGILDFEVLRELLDYFDVACPIIIETTIQDLGIQGTAEVNNLLERVNKNEDGFGK